MVEVEPRAQPQQQPTQVPTYGAYQKRHRKRGAHWYGWQTLTVDGGTLLGGTVLAAADPRAGAAVIIGGYLIGPPIVHFAHGQIGRGFGDLGIRVGAPVVLGTVGYLVFHRDGDLFDSGGAVGLVLGFGFGVLGAIAVDAAVLAYEPREDEDEDANARAVRRHAIRPARMTPMIAPRTEGGVVFGLSGTLN